MKPDQWARAFNQNICPHNLFTEQFHRTLKNRVKPNCRIDDLISHLQKIGFWYVKKQSLRDIGIKNIPKSVAKKTFEDLHEKCAEFEEQYAIQKIHDFEYHVKSKMENSKTYVLKILSDDEMTCDAFTCKVACCLCKDERPIYKHLKVCVHRIVCSCVYYLYHVKCKHAHFLALAFAKDIAELLSNENENAPESAEQINATDEFHPNLQASEMVNEHSLDIQIDNNLPSDNVSGKMNKSCQ